jgi:hypothetical protein
LRDRIRAYKDTLAEQVLEKARKVERAAD